MPKSVTVHLPHRQQEYDYSCLAACARMLLAAHGIEKSEAQLRRLLKTRASVGTHPVNLLRLEQFDLAVTWPRAASLDDLRTQVESNKPCIVFVWSSDLLYWEEVDDIGYLHAVIVAGFSETGVLVHDPALPDGPTEVPVSDFLRAWKRSGHLVAVVEKAT